MWGIFYRDYLKRDDQYLALRLQHEENTYRMAKKAKDRDRALSMAKANDLGISEQNNAAEGEANMEDGEEAPAEALGSRVIVIHVGSQNLRIGLASDALPKAVPMVIARKSKQSESEESGEPVPKRMKMDDGSPMEPETMFGPDVSHAYCCPSRTLQFTNIFFCRCSSPLSILRWPRSSSPTCVRTSGGHFRIQRKWL